MSDKGNIPVLTDLIEKGVEISMSELGLDDNEVRIEADDGVDIEIDAADEIDPLAAHPALEQTIRRILDEHMELALQEIRLAIEREFNKSR